MDNSNLYSKELLHYYKNPEHKGKLEDKNCSSKESNLSCGDSLVIEMKIENNIVKDAKYNGVGCIVSMASAEILCDYIIGKNISECKTITSDSYLKLMGFELSPSRKKCALIGYKAFSNVISKF